MFLSFFSLLFQTETLDSSQYGDVWGGSATPPTIPPEYGDYRGDFHHPPGLTASSQSANNDNSSESSLSSTLDDKKDSTYSRRSVSDDPPLPIKVKRSKLCCCFRRSSKKSRGTQLQCKECHQLFYEKENRPGSCSSQVTFGDKLVSCCTCDSVLSSCLQRSRSNSCKRMTLKILIGLVWPCIWCYKPCKNCQTSAKRRGCAGARHTPMPPILKSSSQSASRL